MAESQEDTTSHPQPSQPTFPMDPILSLPPNITLRPYDIATDPHTLSHHANNINIWNCLRNRMPHPYTPSDSAAWISHSYNTTVATGAYDASTGTASGPQFPTQFAICVNGEAVGSIGLEFDDPTDVYARSAEMGYWLGEAYWGQGIMSKVVPAFVAWAFKTWGILVRLNAEVEVGNAGSQRCVEKAGLVVEGRRRCAVLKNGTLRDVMLMGIVREGL